MALALLTVSCGKEQLDMESHIHESVNELTDFDKWLEENYRAPYNISFLYRYEDIQTDMTYNLAPAEEIYSRILAKMLKYLWIDVYSECGGTDFMRKHSPRMLQIVGSGGWNDNGTTNIGFAEGGQKITLNAGNWMVRGEQWDETRPWTKPWIKIHYVNGVDETDGYSVEIVNREKINGYFLHFAHHEYAHILHQTINYPNEFKTISPTGYVSQWQNLSESEALKLGFVTNYAAGSASEDFVEVLSIYVSVSDDEWETKLRNAGSEGTRIINKKLEMVKSYMKSSWKIDLDRMREVMDRRYNDIAELDWDDFSTGK